jgi:predicted AlkP superfamily pyrophosphatase or phosphodiesterase
MKPIFSLAARLALFGMIWTAERVPLRAADGKAERVVIMVWDGMRPDFIRPQYTPNLSKLAERGVFFKHHHPTFVSSTEVNGTAIITGDYPEHTGISGNRDYRPEIAWTDSIATESLDSARRGDLLTDGRYIPVPTLTDILQGKNFSTIVAGTKGVAFLLDRGWKRTSPAAKDSVTLFQGRTLPRSAAKALAKVNDDKAFPTNVTYPNTDQDAWTAKALTRGLWKKEVPKLSILWSSDPDFSQHDGGPGSDQAIGALESADKNLGMVVAALEEKSLLDTTDIMVVSDHGFSTIQRGIDVAALLKKAGFKAVRRFEDPEPGEILVIGLGGSSALYVVGHDESIIRKLAQYFQTTDYAGVILTGPKVEGAFQLSDARIGGSNAPDLLVSFRWNDERSVYGAPGMLTADGGARGKGTHASLSKYDMRNTLVAAGPDFRQGFIDELPTGNTDLAPTILSILGIAPPQPMDGRVLTEALVNGSDPAPKAEQRTIEAIRDSTFFHWRQYLKISSVGNTVYLDEGDGDSTPK